MSAENKQQKTCTGCLTNPNCNEEAVKCRRKDPKCKTCAQIINNAKKAEQVSCIFLRAGRLYKMFLMWMSTNNNIPTYIYDHLYDSRLIVLGVSDAVNILIANMFNKKPKSVAMNVPDPIFKTRRKAVRSMHQ
jgi:hypothetical protein